MNLVELVDQIAAKHGLEKKQAKTMVEGVFAAVVEAASKGDEVSIPGFGKFKVTRREARTGRNPATGAAVEIAASNKLGFAAAKSVRDTMNPKAPEPEPEPPAKPARGKAKPKAKT